jgi:hypothetical protein
MANEIKLKIKVTDDGNLKIISKNADKAAKGLNQTAKSARTADRNLKGAAQASANSTKNFSKLAQGIGGSLVPAYATLAANIFAVTAAFGAFQRAAQLDQLEASLISVGNVGGKNLKGLANNLKEVTGGAIDTEQALRTVAQGTAQNFSGEQLINLTKIAKGASIALGRDLGDSVDRLIRGTAKLEPEILDELGIIVRLDDATEAYANSLGKTARQLTQFEKQQAFANAVTEQGLKKFGEVAKTAETNPYDKLAATFFDLKKSLFELLNGGLKPLIDFLSKNPMGLVGVLAIFASTLINQLTPALSVFAQNSREAFERLSADAASAAKKVRTKYEKELKGLKNIDFVPEGFKKLEKAIRSGTASIEQLKKAENSLRASERARAAALTKYEGQLKGLRGTQRKAHQALIAEKQAELAAIKAQRQAVERLRAAQASGQANRLAGGSAQAAANNARRASRVGRREATAAGMMQNAGPLGQFTIAARASKNMTSEIGKATGVLGKLSTALKVAASSARLFGAALLNAIPYIGQIIFFSTLAYEALTAVFGDPFEDTATEAAAKASAKNAEEMVKGYSDVAQAQLMAKTSGEKFFIGLKAGEGVIKQSITSLRSLSKAARDEAAKAITEAQEEVEAVGGFWDTVFSAFSGEKGKAIKELSQEFPEARGRFTTEVIEAKIREMRQVAVETAKEAAKKAPIVLDDALDTLDSQIKALQAADFVDQAAVKRLEDFRDGLKKTGEAVPVDQWENFLAELEKSRDPFNKFIAEIQALDGAVSAFDTEYSKLLQRQSTPFSGLLAGAEAVENVLRNISETEGEAKISGKQLEETLSGLGPSSKSLVERLKKVAGFTEDSTISGQALLDAFQKIINPIRQVDEGTRALQSNLKDSKTAQQELAKFAKNSVAFTRALREEKQKELNIQRQLLRNERELIKGSAAETNKKEKLAEIDRELAALDVQSLAITNDKIGLTQALFNETKRRLDTENKILGIQQKAQEIELKNLETRQAGERLAKGRGFAFEYIDQGALKIQQDIERNQKILADLESDTQTEINNNKRAIIQAEYTLLAARLRGEAEIARQRAAEIEPERIEDFATIDALNASASTLDTLASRVDDAQDSAVEQVGAETKARIAGVEQTIAALQQAKVELEPIEQLINTIDNSLTTNLEGAFTALIQGTKSAKDAFADMAKAILSDIAAMIAKQIVLNLLIAATGGTGGFFSNLFGRDGGMFESAPSKRYGGMTEPQTFSTGGIARGREAGYPAILHGTEAVVPLPNGKEIPVQMMNGGQSNNVVVNVNVDNNGNSQQNTQANQSQGANLGNAIAAAVQRELQNQKRSGGILNPYGAA